MTTDAAHDSARIDINELDAIADLAICASMATHSFDESNSEEACALRAQCRLIAERLRKITER